jgi:membrane-associated protease RseP (regulator of RpoE activity)
MLVTAMNLIPIGQLDGGHISYAMFGHRYNTIAQTSLVVLVVLGLSGLLPQFGINFTYGWFGWFVWAMILVFMMRAASLRRVPLEDDEPLDSTRLALGWLCWLIFVGCFSPVPMTIPMQ